MHMPRFTVLVALLAVLSFLPQVASAQDGFDVDTELSGILDGLRTPGPTFQINLRGWAVGTPAPIMGLFYEISEPPGRDFRNNGFGLEFLIRDQVRTNRELMIAVDYADLSGDDGWWKQTNARLRDTRWVENAVSLISAEFMFRLVNHLTADRRLQLYYGAGIGLSAVIGELTQYRVVRECTQAEGANNSIFREGGDCWPEGGDPLFRPETKEAMNVFPIVPFINIGTGLRYLIADRVSIGADVGFRTFYAYAGVHLGIAWQTWVYE